MHPKLIFVEGLTGSGKSTLAHTIARQLKANGIPADWVHEGQDPHPILAQDDAGLEHFLAETRANWHAYFNRDWEGVRVLEASCFNNLAETLWTHNLEPAVIFALLEELYAEIEYIDPALVYLAQTEVESALARNFSRRGPGFRQFVIDYATATPLAQKHGWQGEPGMLRFWEAFVRLTDEAFQRFPGRKIQVEVSDDDWDKYIQQVLDFLAVPLVPEPRVTAAEAQLYAGEYREVKADRQFEVLLRDGALQFCLGDYHRWGMIPSSPGRFEPSGWPFEICFQSAETGVISGFRIEGKAVDYMPLVGVEAIRLSS